MKIISLSKILSFLFLASSLLLSQAADTKAGASVVVALDGSGQYKSVQEALFAAPQDLSPAKPWIIFIKAGIYKERLLAQREKRHVKLVGEDAATTVISFGVHANMIGFEGKPIGTFRTPTVMVDSEDFTMENLTIENSAGPVGQALALRVDGDRVVFRNCRFLGWQDTILANRGRQYFVNCYIEGHVDFIFGGATTFFDHCKIRCLKEGYITAASTPDTQAFGFVFSNCSITGAGPEVKTFLGRPWRLYASTIFLNTEMDDTVKPTGWNNWNKPLAEKTTRYAEYNSSGPGARPDSRVPWSKQLTKAEADAITIEKVLGGTDGWDPRK